MYKIVMSKKSQLKLIDKMVSSAPAALKPNMLRKKKKLLTNKQKKFAKRGTLATRYLSYDQDDRSGRMSSRSRSR